MKEETCVLKDNLNEVREKMIKFDELVIGLPTYNREITGQLKTFYDRLWYDIHNQTFAGKYAIIYSGMRFASLKATTKLISRIDNLRMMIGGGTSHTRWALSEMQRLKGGR